MKRSLLYVLSLSLLLSLSTPARQGGGQRSSSSSARPAPTGAETVIFAVEKYETQVMIEPIVIVRGRRYVEPPVTDETPGGKSVKGQSQRFIDTYFRAGREYRLLFGGGEQGSLRVEKYVEPGCVGLGAQATLQTSARLGGEVQAIATNSATLGQQPASRRAPDEGERAEALRLARAAYQSRRVPAALIKKMETVNLTATDLNRDGRPELIGSFTIKDKDGQPTYSLFMIYEPAGSGFRPALTWYQKGTEESYAVRHLVDQLDLDGDGVAEVIAEGLYYESNDYIIYKKQPGGWRQIYQGGGGGC